MSYPRPRGDGETPGKTPRQGSASFHEHKSTAERHLSKQRPKTESDLLTGRRRNWSDGDHHATGSSGGAAIRQMPMPTKVLVSVAVQQSLWPLHVMAPTGWSVTDLVAAALKLYVKEGRRPALPTAEPSAFGLHYSQFSLECLDPGEKLMELGSRSFFLCPKSPSKCCRHLY